MEYVPIHIKSKVSEEYLKMVRFVADLIEEDDDFDARKRRIYYTKKCKLNEFQKVTGWNNEQVLKYSNWNGNEALCNYPESLQPSVEITCFYIGKRSLFRCSYILTTWFHQVIPDFDKNEIVFAFCGTIGHILRYTPELLLEVKKESFNRYYYFDEENDYEIHETLNQYYNSAYLEELDIMMIIGRGNQFFVPTYSYKYVVEEIKAYWEYRGLKGSLLSGKDK